MSFLKDTSSNILGENFIGFQSLNISHRIFQDTETEEEQDEYTEENDETNSKGIIRLGIVLFKHGIFE